MFWLYELSNEVTGLGSFNINEEFDATGFFLSRKLVTNTYIKNNGNRLEVNGWIKRDLFSKEFFLVANWEDNFENITYINITKHIEKRNMVM